MNHILQDLKNNPKKYLLLTQDAPILYFETPFTGELGIKFNLKIVATQAENRSNKIYIMSKEINKYSISSMKEFIGEIGCIHIGTVSNYLNNNEYSQTTEKKSELKEKRFTAIMQFASMISYVSMLVELGIKNIISAGYVSDTAKRPCGIDDIFLKQFMDAISKALSYSNYDIKFHELQGNWIADILEPLTENEDWFKQRWILFIDKYNLNNFQDIPRIKQLYDNYGDKTHPKPYRANDESTLERDIGGNLRIQSDTDAVFFVGTTSTNDYFNYCIETTYRSGIETEENGEEENEHSENVQSDS